MTIRFDIGNQSALAELVARMEAGEDVVLTRDGEAVAMVSGPPPSRPKGPRRLGIWDHLNLNIPAELFTDPDPELEALMEESIWPKE
jgi:antitoxin (DNA-binding transcriptional repressor) of toxin-antitoxin stability system